MGLFKKSCWTNPTITSAPNPDNFIITQQFQYENAHVLYITYPNCTNYEGQKVLVYLGRYQKQKTRDPHFSSNGGPIARFAPSTKGKKLAHKLAKDL